MLGFIKNFLKKKAPSEVFPPLPNIYADELFSVEEAKELIQTKEFRKLKEFTDKYCSYTNPKPAYGEIIQIDMNPKKGTLAAMAWKALGVTVILNNIEDIAHERLFICPYQDMLSEVSKLNLVPYTPKNCEDAFKPFPDLTALNQQPFFICSLDHPEDKYFSMMKGVQKFRKENLMIEYNELVESIADLHENNKKGLQTGDHNMINLLNISQAKLPQAEKALT